MPGKINCLKLPILFGFINGQTKCKIIKIYIKFEGTTAISNSKYIFLTLCTQI